MRSMSAWLQLTPVLGCALLVCACALPTPGHPAPEVQAVRSDVSVVPWPAQSAARAGAFWIGPDTRIALSRPDDAELRNVASFLTEYVRSATGATVPLAAT